MVCSMATRSNSSTLRPDKVILPANARLKNTTAQDVLHVLKNNPRVAESDSSARGYVVYYASIALLRKQPEGAPYDDLFITVRGGRVLMAHKKKTRCRYCDSLLA